MINTLKDLVVVVGVPVLRSVMGWAEHALKDNKVTKFEKKLLVATVGRVSFTAIAIFFGLNGIGVDINVIGASFGAVLADKFIGALKEDKHTDYANMASIEKK